MKITFILADTTPTYVALVHENQYRPYSKRSVSINLTPEQEMLLRRRETGHINGKVQREIILECFVEEDDEPQEEEKS